MSKHIYEFLVVDRVNGKVHDNWTKAYNDYLLFEDVEGMNLPPQYKVELRV
jgi:hypothetical protein